MRRGGAAGTLLLFGLGLLAAAPGPGMAAAAGPPAPAPAAQRREGLRQLDHLLSTAPASLRGQDGAQLEDYLRRLLRVADRLRQPGVLDPALREAMERQVHRRAGEVLDILRQQRAARQAGEVPDGAPDAAQVLGRFALGVAGQPLLLGGLLIALSLLFLGGVGLGQRRGWRAEPGSRRAPAAPADAPGTSPPVPALDLRRARQVVAEGRPLLLSLSYEIRADRRAEYLAYMERLRDHLVGELGYAYAVWEQEGHPNRFSEMVLCTTPQEFDRLRGPDDSATRRLLRELDRFLREPAQVQRAALTGMAPGPTRVAREPLARRPDAVLRPESWPVPIPRAAREVPPGALPAEAA